MMRFSMIILALLVFSAPAAGREYTFGVVPQQSASKLARLWIPILRQVGEMAGIGLRFETARDIPTFEKKLAKGEYDFAYMNPYHFTVFNEAPGYRAMNRALDKRIRGILVVRKDSPIRSIEELTDMQIAFPAPAAFAASILTRSKLEQLGNRFTPKYVSSHDSVYRTVAKGIYPAGGGIERTLKNSEAEVREQLRILWTSPGYTPHAIAAHPAVESGTLQSVQAGFNRLRDSAEGLSLLGSIKVKGFQSAIDSDWDDVRGLNIHLLDGLNR